MSESWEDVPLIAVTERYAQVPFNGWFLLLAWAAGREHLGRRPGNLSEALPAQETLLDDDAEWIIEMVNDYLVLAGLPRVPPGYLWYLELPRGIASEEEFWARIGILCSDDVNRMPQRSGEDHVRALLPVVTKSLAELY